MRRRIIRYFRVGYYLILLAPVVSVVSLVVTMSLSMIILELLGNQEGMAFTIWNLLILVMWTLGMALYFDGYARSLTTVHESKVILLFSALLIPWAVLTYFFAAGAYTASIIEWMHPGFRPLTLWDHLQFYAWEFKAIVWIGSGLLLIVTSLAKIGISRRHLQTFAL